MPVRPELQPALWRLLILPIGHVAVSCWLPTSSMKRPARNGVFLVATLTLSCAGDGNNHFRCPRDNQQVSSLGRHLFTCFCAKIEVKATFWATVAGEQVKEVRAR
jgi:hypothetical protein